MSVRTQSEDHYLTAMENVQHIEHMWPKEIHELEARLGRAYERSSKLDSRVADIFYMQGRCFFETRGASLKRRAEQSAKFFSLSLAIRLLSLKVFGKKELQLPDLKGLSFGEMLGCVDDAFLKRLQGLIIEQHQKIEEAVFKKNTVAESVAKDLFWLGHSLQKIPAYYSSLFTPDSQLSKESDQAERVKQKQLFESIHGLAMRILQGNTSETALWLRSVEIPVYMGTFLRGIDSPQVVEKAFEGLSDVKRFLVGQGETLAAQTVRADLAQQEATVLWMRASKAGSQEKKLALLRQHDEKLSAATEIAIATAGFSSLTRAHFMYNRARAAMRCREEGTLILNDEEIRELLQVVEKTMQEAAEDHPLFISFLSAIAQSEIHRGRATEAVSYVNRAIQLFSRKFSELCDKRILFDTIVQIVLASDSDSYKRYLVSFLPDVVDFCIRFNKTKTAAICLARALELFVEFFEERRKEEIDRVKDLLEVVLKDLRGHDTRVRLSLLLAAVQFEIKIDDDDLIIDDLDTALRLFERIATKCLEKERELLNELIEQVLPDLKTYQRRYISLFRAAAQFKRRCEEKEKMIAYLTRALDICAEFTGAAKCEKEEVKPLNGFVNETLRSLSREDNTDCSGLYLSLLSSAVKFKIAICDREGAEMYVEEAFLLCQRLSGTCEPALTCDPALIKRVKAELDMFQKQIDAMDPNQRVKSPQLQRTRRLISKPQ